MNCASFCVRVGVFGVPVPNSIPLQGYLQGYIRTLRDVRSLGFRGVEGFLGLGSR